MENSDILALFDVMARILVDASLYDTPQFLEAEDAAWQLARDMVTIGEPNPTAEIEFKERFDAIRELLVALSD